MSGLRIKRVMRLDTIQRHYRLFRICWERGTPKYGGYSTKLAIGLWPRLFCFQRDARTGILVTLLGLRVHYSRSYVGRFA